VAHSTTHPVRVEMEMKPLNAEGQEPLSTSEKFIRQVSERFTTPKPEADWRVVHFGKDSAQNYEDASSTPWYKQRPWATSTNGKPAEISKFCDNHVITSKYSVLTFLPKFLFETFRKLANAYFLLICVMQCIPPISNTGGYPATLPVLMFIVLLDAIFQGILLSLYLSYWYISIFHLSYRYISFFHLSYQVLEDLRRHQV
jgi:hypothetical protein